MDGRKGRWRRRKQIESRRREVMERYLAHLRILSKSIVIVEQGLGVIYEASYTYFHKEKGYSSERVRYHCFITTAIHKVEIIMMYCCFLTDAT